MLHLVFCSSFPSPTRSGFTAKPVQQACQHVCPSASTTPSCELLGSCCKAGAGAPAFDRSPSLGLQAWAALYSVRFVAYVSAAASAFLRTTVGRKELLAKMSKEVGPAELTHWPRSYFSVLLAGRRQAETAVLPTGSERG